MGADLVRLVEYRQPRHTPITRLTRPL